MKFVVSLVLFLAVAVTAKVYLKETFDGDWEKRWVTSDWKKGETGKFKRTAGPYYGNAEEDQGLQTSEDARFYAASTKFTGFSNAGKDLVIQFQVRFPQKIDCGGGYIKVLPAPFDQSAFGGDSKYNIMFGPDVCGTSTKRIHVIFRHPTSDQNLLVKKEIRADTDELSHVYTLIVKPDNTYEVRVDGTKREGGSLYDDWDFLKPKKIPDPSKSKPADWVDKTKIDDPNDVKPADYDKVPKSIPDPEAEKPEDWDDAADGTWEAPTIDNPEYKGPWKAKQIDNPDYKGPWVHPEIDNPDFVDIKDVYKYDDFSGVGIDVWQVKSGTIFDNIIITDDIAEAEALMAATYTKNKDGEKKMFEDAEKAKAAKEEAERKAAEAEKKPEAADDDDDDDDDDEDDKLKDKLKKDEL